MSKWLRLTLVVLCAGFLLTVASYTFTIESYYDSTLSYSPLYNGIYAQKLHGLPFIYAKNSLPQGFFPMLINCPEQGCSKDSVKELNHGQHLNTPLNFIPIHFILDLVCWSIVSASIVTFIYWLRRKK